MKRWEHLILLHVGGFSYHSLPMESSLFIWDTGKAFGLGIVFVFQQVVGVHQCLFLKYRSLWGKGWISLSNWLLLLTPSCLYIASPPKTSQWILLRFRSLSFLFEGSELYFHFDVGNGQRNLPKMSRRNLLSNQSSRSIFCKSVVWNMVLMSKWHKNLNFFFQD